MKTNWSTSFTFLKKWNAKESIYCRQQTLLQWESSSLLDCNFFKYCIFETRAWGLEQLFTFNSCSFQVQMNWGRSNPRGLRKGFTTHSPRCGLSTTIFLLSSIHSLVHSFQRPCNNSFLRLFLCGWRRLSNSCKMRLWSHFSYQLFKANPTVVVQYLPFDPWIWWPFFCVRQTTYLVIDNRDRRPQACQSVWTDSLDCRDGTAKAQLSILRLKFVRKDESELRTNFLSQ